MTRNEPDEATRQLVMERDNWKCALCGDPIEAFRFFSIHHRRSRRIKDDETHSPANLLTLCGSGTTGCHEHVHNHPTESRYSGFIVSQWATPHRTPIEHAVLGDVFLEIDGTWTPAEAPDPVAA